MLRKSLIVVAVLIVLVLILNFAFSWFASRSVENTVRQMFSDPAQTQYTVHFEDININTLSSSFTVNDLIVTDLQTRTTMQMGSATFNISYQDFFRLVREAGSGHPPLIREGQVRINGFQVSHPESGGSVSSEVVALKLSGNMADLIQSMQGGRVPASSQEIDIDIRGMMLSYKRTDQFLEDRDVVENINHIRGRVYYNASTQTLDFMDMNMASDDLRTEWKGRYVPLTEGGAITDGMKGKTEAVLRPVTGRFRLGDSGAGVGFDRMDLEIDGSFVPDMDALDMLLNNDLQVSMKTSGLFIYPPDSFRQNAGQALGFMGIPTDHFHIPSMESKFRLVQDQVLFDVMRLENPYAHIKLQGGIQLVRDDFRTSYWNQAAIRIEPRTGESREFIDSAIRFFGLNIGKDNGDYVIPIRGEIGSPELEGITLN